LALVKILNKSWGLFSRVVAQAGWKWPVCLTTVCLATVCLVIACPTGKMAGIRGQAKGQEQ